MLRTAIEVFTLLCASVKVLEGVGVRRVYLAVYCYKGVHLALCRCQGAGGGGSEASLPCCVLL